MLEDDSGEAFHTAGQGLFLVLIKEKKAILEAGTQDPLMATYSQGPVLNIRVVDCNENWQQLAILVNHREILLVFTHGGDQRLIGQIQELFIKGAADPPGDFNQVGHRINQPLIEDWSTAVPHPLTNRLLDLFDNKGAPLDRISNN